MAGKKSNARKRGGNASGAGRGAQNSASEVQPAAAVRRVVTWSPNNAVAVDEGCRKLETDYLSSMKPGQKKTVSKKIEPKSTESPKIDLPLPSRPAWGTCGIAVSVLANYFDLSIQKTAVSKYTFTITHTQQFSGRQQGSSAGSVNGLPRNLLKSAIETLLTRLPEDNSYATEFKSQLIAVKPLSCLDDDNTFEFEHEALSGRTYRLRAKFSGPEEVRFDDLINHLENQARPAGAVDFPGFSSAFGALNIILGHAPRSAAHIASVGSARFFDVENGESVALPSSQLKLFRGYLQSVRPATGRLLLNVNITSGAFCPDGNLSELIRRAEMGHADNIGKLVQSVMRSRARCQLPNGIVVIKSIAGLAQRSDGQNDPHPPRFTSPEERILHRAREVQFWLQRPGPNATTTEPPTSLKWDTYVTVSDYFRSKYSLTTDIGNQYVANIGTAQRPVFFPADYMTILPGRPSRKPVDPSDGQAMISFAARPPNENFKSIYEVGRPVLQLSEDPERRSVLSKFGAKVGPNFITVKARQLYAPSLAYGGNKKIESRNGSWDMGSAQVSISEKRVNKWLWIHITTRPGGQEVQQAREHVRRFQSFAQDNIGLKWNPGAVLPIELIVGVKNNRASCEDQLVEGLKSLRNAAGADFALVILPSNSSELYNSVKKVGDVTLGLHTICTVERKFLKSVGLKNSDLSYFTNLAMKINLKMGGVNQKIHDSVQQNSKQDLRSALIKEGKTMFVGYDVLHPTDSGLNTQSDAPSLVGLVSSVDKHLGQWPGQYWAQEARKEMVEEQLCNAIRNALKGWSAKNNGSFPRNIVIYRDGVSEGQFSQVISGELPQIRKACADVCGDKPVPKISLVVAVKRHHTRFFQMSNTETGNVLPGTVVDRGITQARYWEFYLTAHFALQGTARPARYVVLLDEIFNKPAQNLMVKTNAADDLETTTHELCYLFGRATKAVSLCPPAYYADILCTRAKVHMRELFNEESKLTEHAKAGLRGVRPHEKLAGSMFYI